MFPLFQHETICQFPSQQFYDGTLRTHLTKYWKSTGALSEEVWPNKAPFVFCHIEGLEESQSIATVDGSEQSKWNKADAAEAVSEGVRSLFSMTVLGKEGGREGIFEIIGESGVVTVRGGSRISV